MGLGHPWILVYSILGGSGNQFLVDTNGGLYILLEILNIKYRSSFKISVEPANLLLVKLCSQLISSGISDHKALGNYCGMEVNCTG